MQTESGKRWFAAGVELFLALVLLAGIWVALPARWWPVDVVGTLLGGLLAVAGVGLLTRRRFGTILSKGLGWITMCIGMLLVTTLAWTSAHLVGLYGPVGGGGALLLGAVAALVVPYLVGLPALQLFVLRSMK